MRAQHTTNDVHPATDRAVISDNARLEAQLAVARLPIRAREAQKTPYRPVRRVLNPPMQVDLQHHAEVRHGP
jgi:hypothetical protein